MHILSSQNRSEFLACPQLVRFDYVNGSNSYEPTLLVKGSTLLLKYIVLGVRLQLVFATIDEYLIYGLRIFDDPEKGALLWSVCECQEEISAIVAIAKGEACQVFLFNELAVNTAWREIQVVVQGQSLECLVADSTTTCVDYSTFKYRAAHILEAIHQNIAADNILIFDIGGFNDWKPVQNHYITNRATANSLDLFDKDEGRQQEHLGLWLTDSLHPSGAHHSLQIPNGNKRRELTDIVLSHEHGSIFVESKALSIFLRDQLPNRAKLAKDMSSHIEKAVSQLRGGMRKVKAGVPITDTKGTPVEIERTHPIHAIVLIPDLDLIEDRKKYGLQFVHKFMKDTGGFLHLLDIAELLRMVQAAEMIAARGTETTPMMAFDFYLLERTKVSLEQENLCFGMLLRFED